MSRQLNVQAGVVKNSYICGQNSEGVEFRAMLLRMTRLTVVFEMHNPAAVLRFSESLTEFKIIFNDRPLYSGKAVVRNLMSTGPSVMVCEATLNENSWTELSVIHTNGHPGRWREEYQNYLAEWQKLYKVRPEYKLVLSDMQGYLANFRLWLDQVEVEIHGSATNSHEMEGKIALELADSCAPALTMLFDQFEEVARGIDESILSGHRVFAHRQLHPLVSCSPFFNRCFTKPLGYAGDYEMVNMMLRNPCEGNSLFAKVLNIWFLRQPPVVAHRNRIDYLVRQLIQFTAHMHRQHKTPRIMTVGCGPAQEVQSFVAEQAISSYADITMLDFNEETLRFTGDLLERLKKKNNRSTRFHAIKKSVHHILKEGGRTVGLSVGAQYDFVYCAGLFDYLSDQVCQRLMDIMYDWLTPGGLLVATNVAAHNPSRAWMEHVTDWYLIYRDARQMAKLAPGQANKEDVRVIAEPSGVNIFLEVDKPEHV